MKDNLPVDIDLDLEIGEDDFEAGDLGFGEMDIDLSAFSVDGIEDDLPARVDTRYVKPPIYVGTRKGPLLYEYAAELARDIGPAILSGERIDAVVSGNFIFGDFLEAFAAETNTYIDDLTLSTLSISRENVDSLQNLIVGGFIGELNIIVSDYWYSHNRQNLPYIYERLDVDDKFQLAVAGIHTKITLMRIGDQKIVMHGSANLRSSRSLENFQVETDETSFDFHRQWHETILDHYATIKKAPRAGKLFDALTAKEI